MIANYFKRIENTIDEYNYIIEDYIISKQTFTQEKGAIEGEIFFSDNSQLDFNEVVNTDYKTKQKYSYHYMDKNKNLFFRCDNVQHHREIETFPHHKHTKYDIVENLIGTVRFLLLFLKFCRYLITQTYEILYFKVRSACLNIGSNNFLLTDM